MRVQKAERCDTQAEPRFPPGAIGAKASKKWRACGLKMAERTGLEPATPGVTGRYSNQLNYRSELWWLPGYVVGVAGVEPATYGL